MEKIKKTLDMLIDSIQSGILPEKLSYAFISTDNGRYCAKWSMMNQLITYMNGYTDAMSFNQWKKKGRKVRKGESAFYIFAPVTYISKSKMVRNENENEENEGQDNKVVNIDELREIRGFKMIPVFGYEQTDGEPVDYSGDVNFIKTLPLLKLAKSWGLEVTTFTRGLKPGLGYYSPGRRISLAVKNLRVWAHELIHAADDRLGTMVRDKGQDPLNEIVADLGGATLLHMIGKGDEADLGNVYEYIESYVKKENYPLINLISKAVGRITNAVNLILEESKSLELKNAS